MNCTAARAHLTTWLGDELIDLKFAVAGLLASMENEGPIKDKLEWWSKRLPDIEEGELPAAEAGIREMEDEVRGGVYEDPIEAMEHLDMGLGRLRGIVRTLRHLRKLLDDMSG